MASFTMHDVRSLLNHEGRPCISLYMPTHPAGVEGRQDPVRLKNLLDSAAEQLAERGMRGGDIRELLAPARGLPNETEWWMHRGRGVALFLAPGRFEAFPLPSEVSEMLMVNERFAIGPLLALLPRERYLVLALSQNQVRLMEGDRYGLEVLETPQLSADLEELLSTPAAERVRQTQARTSEGGRPGRQAVIIHGHGGLEDAKKSEIEQHYRRIDAALEPVLRGETAPLLLAGVEHLMPIYRRVNSYRHVLQTQLAGNFDRAAPRELHALAWPLMEPHFEEARRNAWGAFHVSRAGGHASSDVEDILPAAAEGRVGTLFLETGAHCWGTFDEPAGDVVRHGKQQAGDEDLLDLAAALTLRASGEVYAVPGEELAAEVVSQAVVRVELRY